MNDAPTAAQRLRRRLRKALGRGSLLWRRHGVALLYHRIAEPPADPFELAVTPAHFAQHLEVLRGMGRCVSFEAFAR